MNLLPSLFICSQATIVQTPTSCSLSDFCWARALPGSKASPSAVMTEKLEVHNSLLNVVLHDKPEIKTRDDEAADAE